MLTLASDPANLHAHALRVFAASEGQHIVGSAYFAGGAKAPGVQISASTRDGQRLAQLQTDASGNFSYAPGIVADQVIRADAGDGHAAEWIIPASDLGTPPSSALSPLTAPAQEVMVNPAGATCPPGIEQALARQLRPLREQLLRLEEQRRLQDILGAIGYLFGIAGLALWWRNRRLN